MGISRVEIKSFKSIVSQNISLGSLNIFIGTNGSGKSNFLEALGVLSCAIEGEVNYSKLAEKGVRLSSPEVFKASFKNIRRKSTFSLEADFNGITYHGNINPSANKGFEFSAEKIVSKHGKAGRSNRGQSFSLGKHLDIPKFSRTQGIAPFANIINNFTEKEIAQVNDLADFAIYSLSTPILRGVSPDSSHKEPLGLYGGGLASALFDIIKDIKSDEPSDLHRFFRLLKWFKTIGTTDDISSELQSSHVHTSNRVVKYIDEYMKTNFNELYAYDVSEGALYILFVLVLLMHNNSPNIFALDNVDNALNPGLVRSLMAHVIEILEVHPGKQLFITTHNPITLDSIDLFNPNHRLFVVERNESGHTELNQIKAPKNFTKEKWMAKHKGMRLSEIWLAGLLGGLPEQEI